MDGLRISTRMATWLAAALALSWPGTAAISQETVSDPVVQDLPRTFADRFPAIPEPDTAPVPADGAVDVTEIEPPIEEVAEEIAIGTGTASYYGRRFHGRRTASGERFDMNALTAAHRTLPFGTRSPTPAPGRASWCGSTIAGRSRAIA